MQILFYVCFGVGVGYTVLTFLLGELLGAIDFDLDFDFDGSATPVKPVAASAFLTVFGAVGMLLLGRLHVFAVIVFAGLGGLAVSYSIMRFVVAPLYRAQNTSAIDQASLVGADATVTEKIPQGAYGRITYYAAGNTFNSPARSDDGSELPMNTEVEILYIENNAYYVRRRSQRGEAAETGRLQ